MEQIDSFGSRAARAAKVALLSLSLSQIFPRENENFFIGNTAESWRYCSFNEINSVNI